MSGRTVERKDTVAKALARILAVADLVDESLPAVLEDAIRKGQAALDVRDGTYRATVLVVGETSIQADQWVRANQRENGALMWAVDDGRDLAHHTGPLTIVILPGAGRREDYPQLRAQIAALGPSADIVRIA